MGALTLRLQDEKHKRLKLLAEKQKVSINHLLDEMVTLTLAEFDAMTRFEIRAERGRNKEQRGMELLDKAMQSR